MAASISKPNCEYCCPNGFNSRNRKVLSSATSEWNSFMLLISFGVLIVRGSNVLRSMWYGKASSKAIMQGSKMATRMY